jgi:hypothetical protein
MELLLRRSFDVADLPPPAIDHRNKQLAYELAMSATGRSLADANVGEPVVLLDANRHVEEVTDRLDVRRRVQR